MAIVDLLVSFLVVAGGAFALIGSWGLARLPDLMSRLHGPTKATTLGVGACLLGSMVFFTSREAALSVHELLVTVFLFVTAPVSANLIAKAHLHAARTGEGAEPADGHGLPPPPSAKADWATFAVRDRSASASSNDSGETLPPA